MKHALAALIVALGPALLPVSLAAQTLVTERSSVPVGNPFPLGGEGVVNVGLSWQDEWANVAMTPDGSTWSVTWNDEADRTIRTRFFTGDGVPVTGDVHVNPNFNAGRQDEPMSAADAFGNVFVCWTDRPGNDGSGLGVFGAVLSMDGTPIGPDFIISSTTIDSQWEPMPAPLPGGGWVVAFNGDNDGDAYIRYFDIAGTPTTNDIQFNTFDNNGQTEAEVRALPDGTVLAVFADFGGNVFPFTGTNLFGRRFDASGNAIDASVFALHGSTTAFDQLEPRMANSDDTFVIVWEDRGNDGSGSGIWARRLSPTAGFLEPEFRVNPVTAGNQLFPEVACNARGDFVVCWEDWATGVSRIRARAYQSTGKALGSSFFVSEGVGGGYRRPTVAMSEDGSSIVFAYGGPGLGGGNNSEDIYIRRYAWAFAADTETSTSRPRRKSSPAQPGTLPASGLTPVLQ